MIRKRCAIVSKILFEDEYVTEALVDTDSKLCKAINYNKLTGILKVGDKVSINTNALSLKLGTGGYHFVIENYSIKSRDFSNSKGHIVKLRYTPMQIKCLSAEEDESKYHSIFKNHNSIDGLPVILGELHSMLYPLAYTVKYYNNNIKIVYIMTDSACLPIWHSKVVRQLNKEGNLTGSITYGHAFGGDCEVINLYTALIAAKYIYNADLAVITPGPGVVGTGTTFGFSGIEQAGIIDAVNNLKGYPIIIPRISFSDKRSRHQGMSHHTLTILSKLTYSSANIGVPLFLDESKNMLIKSQIMKNSIDKRHIVHYNNDCFTEKILSVLKQSNFNINTMSRQIHEDPEFFVTIGASIELFFKKIM